MIEYKNEYKKIKTLKEFKEVLENEGGMYWDCWGFDGILNIISCYYDMLSHEDRKQGQHSIAKYDKEKADSIYRYLYNKGYYETK